MIDLVGQENIFEERTEYIDTWKALRTIHESSTGSYEPGRAHYKKCIGYLEEKAKNWKKQEWPTDSPIGRFENKLFELIELALLEHEYRKQQFIRENKGLKNIYRDIDEIF